MRIQHPSPTGIPHLDSWLERLPAEFMGIGWNTVKSFDADDATPSVENYNHFKTANANATTITMFDDGVEGQEIEVFINDANTTIDFTATHLKGNGGFDWTPSSGDSMSCIFDGTDWWCIVSKPSSTTLTALSPLAIPPSAFAPKYHSALQDWAIDWTKVKNYSVLTSEYFFAPVNFPNGAVVTGLTLYGYRNDADATMTLSLVRNDRQGSVGSMAAVTADWTSGYSNKNDASIDDSTVDNDTYDYSLRLNLAPNDGADDVWLSGAKITFTL